MAYRVSLAAPAEADAYAAFERIRAAAPRLAEKWGLAHPFPYLNSRGWPVLVSAFFADTGRGF